VVSANALTDGVPKGCSEGFWHFWHLLTLEVRETKRGPEPFLFRTPARKVPLEGGRGFLD
jgi:hypothetical protein